MNFLAGPMHNKEHDDFSDKKFRKALNVTIIKNFLDLENFSSDSPTYSTLCAFFHHMRNSFKEIPHIFVTSSPQYDNVNGSKQATEKKVEGEEAYLSSAFTEWLMMWLLRVLSQPCASIVHNECKDLFLSLLHLIKFNNILFFRRCVSCLITLLKELSDIADKFDDHEASPVILKNYFQFQKVETEELDLTDISIVLSKPQDCEGLQEKITSILGIITADISQFIPDRYNNLWRVLCLELELGDLILKKESIQALTSSVQNNGLIFSTNLVNYMFNCLGAVISFCTSFCEPITKEVEGLEHAVAPFLNIIIQNIEKPECKFVFDTFTLCTFLQSIIQAVFQQRFIHTNELFQSSVVKGIMFFMNHGNKFGYPLPSDVQKQFFDSLLHLLLTKEHTKILDSLAVFLILYETKTLSSKIYNSNVNFRERKNFNSISFEGMKISYMWCTIYQTLVNKLNCNSVDQINFKLVVSCLKILIHSYSRMFSTDDAEVFKISHSPDLTSDIPVFSQHILKSFNQLLQEWILKQFSTSLYGEIVELYRGLLCNQDLLPLAQEQYLIISNFISIPWLLMMEDTELYDLWYDFIDVQKIKKLEIHVETSTFVQCLKTMVYLPATVSPEWRFHVLKFCLGQGNALQIASIKLTPAFLFSSLFRHEILLELKECFLKLQNIDLIKEVAISLKSFICLFANTCSVFRNFIDENLYPKLKIQCMMCKNNLDQKGEPTLLSTIDCLSELLTYLHNHTSEIVRREAIECITPYLVHYQINENILSVIMHRMVDPDPKVRMKFSEIIGVAFKPLFNAERSNRLEGLQEKLIMTLQASLLASKCSGNLHFQRTVILTTGELGKISDSGLLLITIISLLESYMTSLPSIKVVAFSKLKEIADSKSLKMYDLLKDYRDAICKFLAEFTFARNPENSSQMLFILEEMKTVFEFGDVKSFIQQIQHSILPYIIAKGTGQSSILLECISSNLSIDKREILINNFPFIFSHFVRHCSKVELEKALIFIQEVTGLELGSLLRCNYQHVHNELLLHLSTHYQQVFSGLAILALKSGNVEYSGSMITHVEDMANYLQPKLLGFLVFFDAQMLKSSIDDKKLALESLVSIMELMGSRAVTAVRFKLMATLRLALRFKDKDFPKICCKAWNTFVHSIEVSCLGPLLNQIIVALLPLLGLESDAVIEIFHYLIIEKRAYLSEFYHDLYFVPDTPELQEINTVLRDYNASPSSMTDFCSLLCHSLKGISHENLEVRLHALEKLKQVLHANQAAIYEHLLGRESVDNLLSNLVAALIAGCREPDVRIRIALGECLGELGAIDPGRLDMKSARAQETLDNFYSSIDNEDFAYALIQELVHSFLAAEASGVQDCSACAIQEVLRFYKCSNESGSSGNHLWKRFPPDIQEILVVLFHSQYKPIEKSRRKYPVPIYQSKAGNTFKEWSKNWFYSLLQKVKRENPSKLFHACSIIVKYDLNCTLFLLPHLVIYALLDSTEIEKNEICSEISAVLRHSKESSSINDLCRLSSQVIFSIVDYLVKWLRVYQQENTRSSGRSAGKQTAPKLSEDKNFTTVHDCLSKIPQILLSKAAFSCQAYARALMHLEKFLKECPDQLENNISFLQNIYAALDDPDGVAGVAAIRNNEPTLNDLILEKEATGDLQAAFACYEKAVKLHPEEVNYYGGLLKCFLGMDQPTAAVSYANGILNERIEWKEKLNRYRIEAAWKLANWDSLDSFLKEENNKTEWTVGIGNVLDLANKKDVNSFEKWAKIIRSNQMAPLSAASMEKGAYLRGYEYLIRMHMLTDLQHCGKFIFNMNAQDNTTVNNSILFNEFLPTLTLRKQLIQASPRYLEQIYNLHRVLLKIGKEKMPAYATKFDQEITKCWLQSARLARKSDHQQRAYSCLLEAGAVNSADVFMEKTKWLWNKGEKEQAIYCLQKGIIEHFPSAQIKKSITSSLTSDEKFTCAKAKLLLAIYSEESSIVDSNSLIAMYKEVVSLQPNWEASHFHLAKYYDKMLNTTEVLESRAELMVKVVHNFGTSLKHGCKNVYHSLPRLLDIWFDLGTLQTEDNLKRTPSAWKVLTTCLEKISNLVQEIFESIPQFLFLTAFPQLISRICHSHPSVATPLQKIISRLLASYSQQSMWMMMAVSKSTYLVRSRRCKQIYQEAVLLNPSLGKYITDTTRLADKLIELSNKNVGETNVLSLKENFSGLLKLFEERNFSQIMIPTQTQMIVTLPNGYLSNPEHNAFPFTPVYIRGFADMVEVFPSLQKPKKIIVQGSDGKLYPMMCKPKDDLRKDCRLMEFNNLVNRYLKSDPEARKRQLYIRTYTVVPLNEECGLIEWVPNLHGLRVILSKLYRLKGLFVTGREIRAMMPSKTATFEEKLMIFKTKFLPRFPPVFHDWFLITFPDPTAWYHARLAYARTTAVMSMVGYIVGLGDRHGENILFDSSCGDTVHVDLNCLFNKGETMECPECVPFRLTHNMVDAMGPTGYEGAFRKACEVTMRVMRSKTDALMSVLRPFVHDPLVEWSRSKHNKTQHESGEITNEQGLTHVKDIELRLNGIIKLKTKQQGLPLSIEGQVNHLIQEAVDIKNLSQMYIGWAAYM